ncbi:MAG: tripartite tricarboxylate transporter TctB family protein [Rhizobiaceae bacterium]
MSRKIDLVVSTILLILPVFLLVQTFSEEFDVPTFGGDVGPTFAPRVYFVVWILLAGIAVFSAWRSQETAPSETEGSVRIGQLLTVMVIGSGTAFAMINVGFLFATIPGFFLFCLAFGYRNYITLLILSVLGPIIIWAMFTFVFELLLPKSPWFNFF